MTKQTRTIILTVIATLIVVCILQNMGAVIVRFILWHFSVPLSLFVVVVAGLGFTAGMFWRRR